MDGDNGASSVRELLRDKHSGTPELKHEQHQGVPNDALKDHNLNHEAPRELTIHTFEQRDAHDQGVGEGGEGEQSYGPLQATPFGEVAPDCKKD